MIGLVAMNSAAFIFLLSNNIFPTNTSDSDDFFATRFGMAYIVIYNQSLWQAFNNGWELFRANWIITIESAITILLFSIVYIVVGMASIAFIFTPFIVLALLDADKSNRILYPDYNRSLRYRCILTHHFYGAFYNLLGPHFLTPQWQGAESQQSTQNSP